MLVFVILVFKLYLFFLCAINFGAVSLSPAISLAAFSRVKISPFGMTEVFDHGLCTNIVVLL